MVENKNFFRASAEDFKKIPGRPVAYWLKGKDLFQKTKIGDLYISGGRNKTHGNEQYLRKWWEISFSNPRWMMYANGGEFRKYFGNEVDVVDWSEEARSSYESHGGLANKKFWGHQGICWSLITSAATSFRIKSAYAQYSSGSPTLFDSHLDLSLEMLAYLNSPIARYFLKALNPTINTTFNDVASLPYISVNRTDITNREEKLLFLSHADWDLQERSRDFKVNPLVAERMREVVGGKVDSGKREVDSGQWIVDSGVDREKWIVDSAKGATNHSPLTTNHSPLSTLYAALRRRWAAACEEMRRLEIENNRIFIEAYGLQDELTPDVPWNEITLTCNPWYRYGVRGEGLGIGDEGLGIRDDGLPQTGELEERLRADTVKELVSYAVGCMMGRYSLEKPGLILADQASTIADYWEKLGKLGIRDDELGIGDELGMRNEELGIGGGCEFEGRKEEFGMAGGAFGDRALPSSALIPHSPSPIPHPPSLIPNPSSHIPHSFSPDDDGIIPVLDNDWFADDIVTRFKAFVKAAFGEKHFFENMAWIEEALGKDIRSYFTKDFYKDHLQRYQNRPIYWLFQSPKGAFRALIYMHRYRPDTVGGVLGYLRSLQTKIDNQLDVAMRIGADESKSASERVQANKDIVKYARAKKELDEYEKNVLYPLSTERIEIDLDDGVKVNYRKFGAALAKVKALEGKGE